MKGKFRILGRLGLAVVVISGILLMATPVAAATAVTNVWVEYTASTGNDINNAGEHIIHFTTVTAMKRGVDTITVIYPTAFDLSGVQTAGQYYNVKGTATTYTEVDRSVVTGGKRIEVITPVDIPAGTAASLKVARLRGPAERPAFKKYIRSVQAHTGHQPLAADP